MSNGKEQNKIQITNSEFNNNNNNEPNHYSAANFSNN